MAAATAFFLRLPAGSSEFKVNPRHGFAEITLRSQPKYEFIESIDGYTVLQPIPVSYDALSDTDVEARFDQANIAMSGVTRQDAYQALVEDILVAFDDWSANESALGPAPRQQLAVLRKYLAKTTP